MTKPPVLPDERDGITEKSLSHAEGLFRHVKRHDWGLALLASEEGGRRAYQFDDGKLRVFKEGYYSLMEPVETAKREEDVVMDDLRKTMDLNRGASDKELAPACTFQEQITTFTDLYPKGFLDPTWVNKNRRRDKGKSLKRHHGASSKLAQERLSASCFDLFFNEERPEAIHAAAVEVLLGTDLVPVKHVHALASLDDEQKVVFAVALRDLMYGDEEYEVRFKGYVRIMRQLLGERPTWRMATVLPALIQPKEHVCVRYTSFIRQAASIAPDGMYTKRPRRGAYTSFLNVAVAVKAKLDEAGHDPRDLLDVHDFVWATLRPAAVQDRTK